jgi:hypothetical protein
LAASTDSGALLAMRRGQLLGLLAQFSVGDDPVHQADPLGSVGVDQVASQQDLHRRAGRDKPRQRRGPGSAAADFHLGDREPR